MKNEETLVLGRRDVAELLSLDECIAAVEQAFRIHAAGHSLPPATLGIPARDGGFHIKAAGLRRERTYFAAKVNGNFFHNQERFGLPRIQGVIVLCDGETGSPLALMDSIEVTILRTGAVTAVAAKHLARRDAHVATICGCGNQGRVQLRSLARVLRLSRAYLHDVNETQAEQMGRDLSSELQIEARPARDLAAAVGQSDVCVTATPSRRFFMRREWVRPGTFIAAVGADSEEKQELDPALFRGTKVVVDKLEQCAAIGDLHHALDAEVVTQADVHAELSEVVSGAKPGRTRENEITIFDSTGIGLEDVAAAAVVYEKAIRAARGVAVRLGG